MNTSAIVKGGAIHVKSGDLVIADSRFSYNAAKGLAAYGGAISVYGGGSGKVTITDSQFIDNVAQGNNLQSGVAMGGAINVALGRLTVEDSVFYGNWAMASNGLSDGLGGTIVTDKSHLSLRRNTFVRNKAAIAGAIFAQRGPAATFIDFTASDNTFVANEARNGDAGAIKVTSITTLLKNNSFFKNLAVFGPNNFVGGRYVSTTWVPGYYFHNNLMLDDADGSSCRVGSDATVVSSYNLIQDSSCDLASEPTNILSTSVHVQGYRIKSDGLVRADWPLRPFLDSPAIDQAQPGPPDDIERGYCRERDGQDNPRNGDGNADGEARCDIGAFEWQHEAFLFADDYEERIQP